MSALKDRYINPLTDFGFKKLFGTEPNKDLVIDFLNQILPEHHQIKDLSYARNEHLGQKALDRKAIFDLYCVAITGERFIIEIQKAKHNFFKDRSVYYASFPIQEQALKGQWNYKLEPVYTIGILDFEFEDHKADEEYMHVIELKNQRCEVFYEKLKFIYIELPKFKKSQEELETHFDKWLFVLRHLPNLDGRPPQLQERIFQRLFEAAELAKFSPDERGAYEDSLKYYRDLKGVIETAEEEGLQKGLEKGLQKGLQKGINQRSVEIAKKMKSNGEALEKIMDYTGLSEAEIRRL